LLCLLNATGYIVLINKALTDVLGYSDEELISKQFLDFIHPEDKGDTIKQVELLLKTGAGCMFISRFLRADGQYKWFSWNISQLPDKTLYISVRDIVQYNKHKEQLYKAVSDNREKALNESEKNYKLLFYSSPLPIIIYDMETLAILDVNNAATQLYGYTHQEFLTMRITDLRHPDGVEKMIEGIRNRVVDGEIVDMGTKNHVKKNGENIKVNIVRHSVKYKERNCTIVICKDVTEQTNALQSLEMSNERFEYVTKATSDIIWDWNLITDEVYYSDNINTLFGHTPGFRYDNLPFYFEHVHPDDRERVVLYPDQVKYGDFINWTQEYRFKKADGEYAFVLDKGIVIRDEKGVGVRMIGAMQDITISKQNELRVIHQNDQLLEIARINAHEIRRPVASVLGLMQLFDKMSIGESNRELLDLLETATGELDVVIRRIIDKTVF